MQGRIQSIALALLGLFFIGPATLRADVAFTVHENLPFSEDAPELTLDLYRPDIEGPLPCVIVIQGGGFLPQNGQRFKSFAEHLAKNGFAAALISYRGRPDADYRETMADVRASVRFVRRESEKYGIDPKRIGATGRSAGGTLAALLAVSDGTEGDQGIQAAVCFAGVFDFVGRFNKEEQVALQPQIATKKGTNGQWIGAPYSPTDADWLAASAITQVDAEDPPVLFLHSKNDKIVPWLQSRDIHAAMVAAGVKSEATIYETGGHQVNPEGASSLDAMVAFFRKHLSSAQVELNSYPGYESKTLTLNIEGLHPPALYFRSTAEGKRPLAIFLHGGGGDRGGKIVNPRSEVAHQMSELKLTCDVLHPLSIGGWSPAALDALIDLMIEQHAIDPDRIYILGSSMGGAGTWKYGFEGKHDIAAFVPIASGASKTDKVHDHWDITQMKDKPIWMFHGETDTVVPFANAQETAEKMKAINPQFKWTAFPGVGHGSRGPALKTDELYVWLLQQNARE